MNKKSDIFHCPLCGFKFKKENSECTHGCPLGKFCKLIKCPSCRYEFPETSRPLAWLAKLIHPTPASPRVALDLTQAEAGETVEFIGMLLGAESRGRALAVYGVTPGAQITLQQKRPSYILRVGETELAIDADIARQILVRKPNAA
jgi:Fe2+ transport system protein FeoA